MLWLLAFTIMLHIVLLVLNLLVCWQCKNGQISWLVLLHYDSKQKLLSAISSSKQNTITVVRLDGQVFASGFSRSSNSAVIVVSDFEHST